MLIVHSLLFLVLSSTVTPQPALLYNWIQPPPAAASAFYPLYVFRPGPLSQIPYFRTPSRPLQQSDREMALLDVSEQVCEVGKSVPHPTYCDKYYICSESDEDKKVISPCLLSYLVVLC